MNNNWKETTLGEIAVVDWGNTNLTKSSYVLNGEYLGVSAAGADGRMSHAEHHIGTIVLSAIGENCGFVIRPQEDFTAIKNTITITARPNKVNDLYLYYRLIKNRIPRRGAAQPFLSKGDTVAYRITLPPLEEQKKIAGILGSLDDKIELLRKENETLEKLAQTLFKRWFVDFEFPADSALHNQAGRPISSTSPAKGGEGDGVRGYKSSGGKMIDSKLGPIPEGWRVGRLDDFVSVISGYAYGGDELVDSSNEALVTLKSFDRDGGFQIRGFKPFRGDPKPEHRVEIGDLVVAHTDLTQAADVLGNPAFIFSNGGFEKMYITMDLAKIVSQTSDIRIGFLYFLMKTHSFKRHCVGYSNGTTVLHMSRKAIPNYELSIPEDLALVRQFSDMAGVSLKKIIGNSSQIQTLSRLRDTLLPKLMSGDHIFIV